MPYYRLRGISPDTFKLDSPLQGPYAQTAYPFTVTDPMGTYTYRIDVYDSSSSSQPVNSIQAAIIVQNSLQPCTPDATPSATAPPTPTSTSLPGAGFDVNTSTLTATQTPLPSTTLAPSDTATTTPAPSFTPSSSLTPAAPAGNTPVGIDAVAPSPSPTFITIYGWTATATARARSASTRRPAKEPRKTTKHVITQRAGRPAPCSAALQRAAALTLIVNAYVQRGRSHIDLSLTMTQRGQQIGGSLRLHDAATRLTLLSHRLIDLRTSCNRIEIAGRGQAGSRVVPFTVMVMLDPHHPTVELDVPALHYRVGGPLRGHPMTLKTVPLPHKSTTSSPARKAPGRGKPAGHKK